MPAKASWGFDYRSRGGVRYVQITDLPLLSFQGGYPFDVMDPHVKSLIKAALRTEAADLHYVFWHAELDTYLVQSSRRRKERFDRRHSNRHVSGACQRKVSCTFSAEKVPKKDVFNLDHGRHYIAVISVSKHNGTFFMPAYRFENFIPVVDPAAYVHPTASLIGDVIIGANCYVGPGASLRGDFGRIVLAPGSNLQDNCVTHSFPGRDVIVEENGHVGHGAILHGCIVGRGALVGMNSVIMDGAQVGEAAFVAAMSFVKAGFQIPPRHLVAGIPAKLIRELDDSEISWKAGGTFEYQDLARRCLAGLAPCTPLKQIEADRPRTLAASATPSHRPKNA
jgi:phenylacetic acid degradation protein